MSSSQKDTGNWLVNGIAMILAFAWLLIDLTAVRLCKRAYVRGIDTFCGILAAGGAAVYTGYLATAHGYNIWACIAGPLLAFLLSMFLVYPILHIALVRPLAQRLVWPFLKNWVWPFVRYICTQLNRLRKWLVTKFGPACNGLVRLTQFVSPGSKQLWAIFDNEKRHSWSRDLFDGLAVLLVWLSGAIIGYHTYNYLRPMSEDWVWPVFVAAIVWSISGGILHKMLSLGKRQFCVLVVGGASIYQFSALLTQLSNLLDGYCRTESPLAWEIGVKVEVFILFVAYAFPLLDLFLNDALKAFWKFVEKLPEHAYKKETDKDVQQILSHLANFALTGAAVYYTVLLCGLPGLSLGWTIAIAAVVGIAGYFAFFQAVNHEYVGVVSGIFAALIAGWEAGSRWVAADLWFGYWGAVVAAVLAMLFTGFIGYALFRLFVHKVVVVTGAGALGPKLTSIYDWLVKNVLERSWDALENNYKACFTEKDDSGYPVAFGHVMNLVGAYLAYQGSALFCTSFGLGLIWSGVIIIPSVVLTYLFFGRLLAKTTPVEVVGVLASAASGLTVLQLLFQWDNNFWMQAVTVIATVAAVSGTWFFAYPLAFRLFRAISKKVLLGRVGKTLAAIHEKCWDTMVAILDAAWELFLKISRWVHAKILVPAGRLYRWMAARVSRFFGWIGRGLAWLQALVAGWVAPIRAFFAPIFAAIGRRAVEIFVQTVATYRRIWARISGKPVKDKEDEPKPAAEGDGDKPADDSVSQG
jgi:hypothetical protein